MARRHTRRALAVVPVVALAVTAAGCAQQVNTGGNTEAGGQITLVEAGKLTTCTHLPYAPFQFTQGDKTVGFDVDLVDLVLPLVGASEQKIFDTPFEGIQTGESLNIGKCDVAAAAMTIKPERQAVMDFSDPYFDAKQALLVKKGSGLDSLEKLRGKKLGVQQGTTGEKYANENKDKFGYEIIQFEDLALEQTAVKTGQVDAGINDDVVLLDYLKANPDVEVTTTFDTGEVYGIAVKKGNGALLAKVNEALKKAKSDGTYDRIYEKWFGKKPTP
ncbi:transporter substrate-binding domain-containing protein [Amycolatopsis suaedae]|uniref:Transporter substrate-binding domain-containing protein n=1 Tax=Amycolatopsis suaedae TaxID=2510978 RepID=A0A4V2EMI1_9PSEU|nr:transporter substrate-binding domain-containing protein [Amycolatopsis suaedae]RZQ65145.1 transporter substrate-binding domain-containing protein [Amycolatopsis suaedae]